MWDPNYSREGEQTAPLLGNQKVYYQKAPTRTTSESYDFPSSSSAPAHSKGIKTEGRKWNDLLFALLFLLMCGGFVAISLLSFSKGEPSRLVPTGKWSFVVENRGKYWFQDAIAQAKEDRWILVGALGGALVLGFVWVQLMRMFTKLFIYATIFVGIIMVLALGVYMFSLGLHKNSKSLKFASFGVFGVAGCLFIAVILLRKKIALTSALFKETCLGVRNNPGILLVCAIVVACFAAFSVYWVASFIYLYSIPGERVDVDFNSHYITVAPQFNTKIRNLLYFQVFAFFWISSFFSAVFQMSVAGAISTWYFSRDMNGYGSDVTSPAFRSLRHALTTSFGSMALGSLILAIVQFINFVLSQARRANRYQGNRVVSCLLCVVQCIVGCIQGLVKFVNRFAYIYIAIHGDGFFASSKNCFQLISRNLFSVTVIDTLGFFVLFVGRLLGTAASVLCTIIVLHMNNRPISSVTLVLVGLISYLIFNLFSKILHVGVDSIFVSYLMDLEKNKNEGATSAHQLHISPQLHHMLQEQKGNVQGYQESNLGN